MPNSVPEASPISALRLTDEAQHRAQADRDMRDRYQHDADDADRDRGDRAEARPLAEEDKREHRRLRRLGARIGGADGEVAEREQMDEQEGRGDLAERAEQRPAEEGRVKRRQRIADEPMQHGDENKREGKAEAETHEGRSGRAHHGLQMFLHRRAQVLQKRGGDGDGDPEFHGGTTGASVGTPPAERGSARTATAIATVWPAQAAAE